MLDPSRPLVKSTKRPTRPVGPAFAEGTLTEERRREQQNRVLSEEARKTRLQEARENERRFLRAQFEFEREKRLAERIVYSREQAIAQRARMAKSPFLVDLAADHERIDEQAAIRRRDEQTRAARVQQAKVRFRNELLASATQETPLVEHARLQRRSQAADERRERALRRLEVVDQRYNDAQRQKAELRASVEQRVEQELMEEARAARSAYR